LNWATARFFYQNITFFESKFFCFSFFDIALSDIRKIKVKIIVKVCISHHIAKYIIWVWLKIHRIFAPITSNGISDCFFESDFCRFVIRYYFKQFLENGTIKERVKTILQFVASDEKYFWQIYAVIFI